MDIWKPARSWTGWGHKMTTDPRQAVIYARYSPQRNADKKSMTIDAQVAYCRDSCEREGWDVVSVFQDEALSGANVDRPGLESALTHTCQVKGVFVVYSLSRASRSAKHAIGLAERLEKCGADFKSATEPFDTSTPHGRFFFHLMSILGQLDRELIAERTSQLMLEHQKAGRRMSLHAPIGWAVDWEDPTRLVEHPGEQNAIRLVAILRKKGLSYRAIAEQLDKSGVKARGGRPWAFGQIGRIVKRLAV